MQHAVLSYLAKTGFGGVFKGGTCLQKAFSLPRYSEDIDFTLNDATFVLPDFDALSAFLSSYGFGQTKVKKASDFRFLSAKLRVQGPLYNGKELSEATVILEFSLREKTIFPPVAKTITPPYPDFLAYALPVMDEKEIACEKIRAILTRYSARDLFDLYFLLRQESISVEKNWVDEKLKYYDKKFGFEEFAERVGKVKKIWVKEISSLTPNPVDYETAAGLVLEKTKQWLG